MTTLFLTSDVTRLALTPLLVNCPGKGSQLLHRVPESRKGCYANYAFLLISRGPVCPSAALRNVKWLTRLHNRV